MILVESAPQGSDFLAKICIDWEKEALAAEKSGVRLVLLRTGIVLSTRGGMLQKMLAPFRFLLEGQLALVSSASRGFILMTKLPVFLRHWIILLIAELLIWSVRNPFP